MWGGMGFDMVSYENAAQGVKIDLRPMGPVNGAVQSGAGEENGDDIWYVDGIIGSNHNDTLIASNNYYVDYISINNLLMGLDGDDILMGLSGGDTLDGGEGRDTADYSLSPSAVRIDLNLQDGVAVQSGGAAGNDGDGDVLISIENVTGSEFNDTLIGDGDDNVLMGQAGDDSLVGGAGDDTLIGGAGNDTLLGGDGDDLLVGGMDDVLDGGAGFDTFRLESDPGTGGILDLSLMNAGGRITGIERIDITGDADDANTLTLRAEDVLDTTGGADTLWVRGDGNDTVTTSDTGWTLAGTQTGADGQTYNHYTAYAGSTLVNLLIDIDIAAQNIAL
jgi:Ca2+-binding RTX toxin-like protein